jgi:TonB family protein
LAAPGRGRVLRRAFSLTVGLLLYSLPSFAAGSLLIRVHLFQGAWVSESPAFRGVTIFTSSSLAALAPTKQRGERSERELKTAAIEALMDILDLKSLDDLFSISRKLESPKSRSSDTILHNETVFRIDLAAKRLSPHQVTLRAVLARSRPDALLKRKSVQGELQQAYEVSRNRKLMETISNQDLVLDADDPVILGVPYKDRVYLLMILVTTNGDGSARNAVPEIKTAEPLDILTAPRLIHRIPPAYPEELRRQGFVGEVELRLTTDREGSVVAADVTKPLHPYLDYAAVRAVREWRFEPALKKGKAVAARFTLTIVFDPETYDPLEEGAESEDSSPVEAAPSAQLELQAILDRCAEYSRKLAGSALDFVCEETIEDTHFSFGEGNLWGGIGGGTIESRRRPLDPEQDWNIERPRPVLSEFKQMAAMPLFDPGQTQKNKYTCDYQLIKKGKKIAERRILLKENGRKVTDVNKLLEEKRFGMFNPLFALVRVLGRASQPLFSYRLLQDEKVKGKTACIIQAIKKHGKEGWIESAKLWVDKKSSQILQTEITGVPLEGYEDVLRDATRYNLDPIFTIRCSYFVEKRGLLFPSRTETRVVYQSLASGQGKATKINTNITYQGYKFFTVETDQEIR